MIMKRIILSAALAVALSTSGMLGIGAALAAPGDNGSGNGGCVDNLYGNATNERPSGNGVLPSQSPGPFVNTGFNEPPRNDQVRGLSVGDVMQLGTGAGLNGQETMAIICTFP
jgi:hypothetical protein